MRNIVRIYRELEVERVSTVGLLAEVATKFRVDYRTVKKAIKHYDLNIPLPVLGRPVMEKKHIYDYIEILVREQPTQFLSTIRQKLIDDVNIRLSVRQINRILRHELKFRRKRISQIARKRRTERIQTLRKIWRDEVWTLEPNRFIFIDEVHFDYRNWIFQGR